MPIEALVQSLLSRPREEQVSAARAALSAMPSEAVPEAWNSTFGPGSLFDAWCQTSVARGVHESLRRVLTPVVSQPGFRVIDVGGGDGSLWRGWLTGAHRGELVVVDPVPEAIEAVRRVVPEGVVVTGCVGAVQEVTLPEADALVCSLTLHHVAGRDRADRHTYGLSGVGKLEVLRAFAEALRPRGGLGVLVEADVDCDLELAPGDPVLRDHIFDSYVRRCARSVLVDLQGDAPAELKDRWRGLLRHWFLGQLSVADAPRAARDVYELTVGRWLALLEEAELRVQDHRFIDDLPLFHRYVFRP